MRVEQPFEYHTKSSEVGEPSIIVKSLHIMTKTTKAKLYPQKFVHLRMEAIDFLPKFPHLLMGIIAVTPF